MSKPFIQASRLFLSTCLASMLVLSACGGGSSESGSQAPANSDQATPVSTEETWSMVESAPPTNTVGAQDFVLWNGAPETLPADTLASSTWWLQNSRSGAYLPGLGELQAFASSVHMADGNTLFLVRDGQVFQVDIRQAPNWQPIRVSSINNAASIEASFQDSTGQTVLRVKTLSDTLVVIKSNAAMTDVPQPLPVSTVYELHAFWDANGRLQGRLVIDRDKWELALLSDDEDRVLQHFPLPEELDRAALPARWIGPHWRAHAGVMQIGQGLYRFDWRGPIATLSGRLYELQTVDTQLNPRRYSADDKTLYVQDGWDIICIAPTGQASQIKVEHQTETPSKGGISNMLLTRASLVVHYNSGTGPYAGRIRLFDRRTLVAVDIEPTTANASINRLIWAEDQSIGFFEFGVGGRKLIRLTLADHQRTVLAVNPYVFDQPFANESVIPSEAGISHRFSWWALDLPTDPAYVPDWNEPPQYLAQERASQIWWCDSTENGAISRTCDPSEGATIKRYDIQIRQLTQQGNWPTDAHITNVAVMPSGLAWVVDRDLVDPTLSGFRTGLWRFDTSGAQAPFFLSAQLDPKVSQASPTPAEASSLTSQSKSE